MANICDYIKWRGNLTLEQSQFNEMISKTLNELFKIGRDNIFNTFNK